MQLGGFVKQSLIDYPGKVASVLFTRGCNFRCGYCHNPALVLPHRYHQLESVDPDSVWEYLWARKGWIDGVVVTGGEPTLHSDLPDWLARIKKMDYLVKLDTNGSDPYMLQEVIERGLVDYVAMDVKNVLTVKDYCQTTGIPENQRLIDNIIASMLVLKNAPVTVEFRTTAAPNIDTPQILQLITHMMGKNMTYNINKFKDGNTLDKDPNR
ncbi:MAG: anaerobic ribonucleoside-triphosphate reductase activating protein [Breznakibacter sp.]